MVGLAILVVLGSACGATKDAAPPTIPGAAGIPSCAKPGFGLPRVSAITLLAVPKPETKANLMAPLFSIPGGCIVGFGSTPQGETYSLARGISARQIAWVIEELEKTGTFVRVSEVPAPAST